MNNILFFLTPKAMCVYLYDDFTIRQALEKMESAGYAALPILNKRGEYRGTLTEGDLMWAIKNMYMPSVVTGVALGNISLLNPP